MIVPGLNIGEVIAEKYRLDKVLGAGGMGVVVSARHLQLDVQVAIKFLAPTAASDATALSRFDREARAAAKITSAHVVRVFDVGRLPSGAPYMVMEQLVGTDLSAWIARAGQLPIEQASDFLLQACSALGEAHRLGIVHRDIKPSNLFCVFQGDASPSIKVLDFGVSKLTQAAAVDGGITATAAAIGSPSYMSPEQMRSSSQVDQRADLWSLGVVLYELLTAKLPFRGATYPEICLKVAGEPPEPAELHRADLPAPLLAVIAKCLRKNPAERYAQVSEFATDLLPFASPRARQSFERVLLPVALAPAPGSVAASTGERTAVPDLPTSTWGKSTWARTSDPLHKIPVRWVLATGVLALLMVLLAVGLWWSRGADPGESSAAVSAVPESPPAVLPTPRPLDPSLHAAVGESARAPLPAPSPEPISEPSPPSVEPSAPPAAMPSANGPPAAAASGARVAPSGKAASVGTPRSSAQRSKNQVWSKRE